MTPIVYIVDDDVLVRKALRRLIHTMGFAAETFSSALDFLNYPHQEQQSCLILDVRMPGLSGLDLQKQLSARSPAIPIIFVTAHDDDQAQAQALKAGALAFLVKPFDDQELLNVLAAALHLGLSI